MGDWSIGVHVASPSVTAIGTKLSFFTQRYLAGRSPGGVPRAMARRRRGRGTLYVRAQAFESSIRGPHASGARTTTRLRLDKTNEGGMQ